MYKQEDEADGQSAPRQENVTGLAASFAGNVCFRAMFRCVFLAAPVRSTQPIGGQG
jgi:hypothetical protein